MKFNIIKIICISVCCILMIPFIASQFNPDVNWEIQDYVIAGAILLGVGFLINVAFNRLKTVKHKTIIVLFVLLLLLWAEMRVGIFGSPITGS
ncbi:MAG: hypothetical protein HRT67_04730 [Flavobacteriaceae bacterium]|nr:hypothetical protein [Flavobacteriaceae bacterium]